MKTLEVALRRALEKGDISDADFRRRVYVAAASALQRSAQARPNVPSERLRAQTEDLTAIIETIEQELRGAPGQAAARTAQQPARGTQQPLPAGTLHVEPKPSELPPEPEPAAPKRGRASPLRLARGPFAALLAGVVLTALIVMGVIWVVVTGAFVPEEVRDTAVRNPPPVLAEESFAGDEGAVVRGAARDVGPSAAGDGWIVLFTPADPTALRLVGGATASIEADPFGAYALLATPTADSIVRVDMPAGTLQTLAGETVEVSLRARTDDSNPAQISVTCDLGALGDCGRRRFNLGPAEAEYLFRFNLPEAQAAIEAGALQITTGLGEFNNAIRLIGVSVRPAEG